MVIVLDPLQGDSKRLQQHCCVQHILRRALGDDASVQQQHLVATGRFPDVVRGSDHGGAAGECHLY